MLTYHVMCPVCRAEYDLTIAKGRPTVCGMCGSERACTSEPVTVPGYASPMPLGVRYVCNNTLAPARAEVTRDDVLEAMAREADKQREVSALYCSNCNDLIFGLRCGNCGDPRSAGHTHPNTEPCNDDCRANCTVCDNTGCYACRYNYGEN